MSNAIFVLLMGGIVGFIVFPAVVMLARAMSNAIIWFVEYLDECGL